MQHTNLGAKLPAGTPLALTPETRRRHMYVLGKSGTGKTTLLRNLILEDLRHGEGVALLDPHGDLVEDLLHHIPRRRTHELIYFDPTNPEHTPGLNVLAGLTATERHLLISDMVAIFTNLWPDFWGPRTDRAGDEAIARGGVPSSRAREA